MESESVAVEDPQYWKKPMASYLVRYHSHQLRSIASSPDSNLHFPLYVELVNPLPIPHASFIPLSLFTAKLSLL